jgi:chromosomal replication initiation ATPase DnaA
MSPKAELDEVFLYAYRAGGLRAALDAHARAAVLYAHRKPPARITLEPIRIVCEMYGLRPAQLLERARRYPLPEARAIAAKVLREVHGLSFPAIGGLLNIDHTSVMAAIRRCDESPTLTAKAHGVIAQLGAAEAKAA